MSRKIISWKNITDAFRDKMNSSHVKFVYFDNVSICSSVKIKIIEVNHMMLILDAVLSINRYIDPHYHRIFSQIACLSDCILEELKRAGIDKIDDSCVLHYGENTDTKIDISECTKMKRLQDNVKDYIEKHRLSLFGLVAKAITIVHMIGNNKPELIHDKIEFEAKVKAVTRSVGRPSKKSSVNKHKQDIYKKIKADLAAATATIAASVAASVASPFNIDTPSTNIQQQPQSAHTTLSTPPPQINTSNADVISTMYDDFGLFSFDFDFDSDPVPTVSILQNTTDFPLFSECS